MAVVPVSANVLRVMSRWKWMGAPPLQRWQFWITAHQTMAVLENRRPEMEGWQRKGFWRLALGSVTARRMEE
jgi:hypothetical protein